MARAFFFFSGPIFRIFAVVVVQKKINEIEREEFVPSKGFRKRTDQDRDYLFEVSFEDFVATTLRQVFVRIKAK